MIEQKCKIFYSIDEIKEKCNCYKLLEIAKQEKEYEEFRKKELNKKIKQYYGTEFITKQFKSKTLDSFIANEENIKTKLFAEKFINEFKTMKKGLMFVGQKGTGKTHISIAIANELIKQNIPVIFGTLTELLERYTQSCEIEKEIELTKLYAKVDLLIIDDLGAENINEWVLSKLFVILNERMKNELPVVITTNYNIDQLKERLTTNKLCQTTSSIISRLCYMCYRVECK